MDLLLGYKSGEELSAVNEPFIEAFVMEKNRKFLFLLTEMQWKIRLVLILRFLGKRKQENP